MTDEQEITPDDVATLSYEDLVAENMALRAQLSTAGATAFAGPGTPEHFYAVGGVGDVVLHPTTGEPLLNPQTGAPIVQEHPSVEADALVAAAEAKLVKVTAWAELLVADATQAVADAHAAAAAADARWDEIVAHLVTQSEGA